MCKENPAVSPHHITPRAEGGGDDRKNIVDLCRRCHNIVEEIYSETGMKYSPDLIRLIRLKFKFIATQQVSVEQVDGVEERRQVFKFRQTQNQKLPPTVVTCPMCGTEHLPKKFSVALCMVCSGESARIERKREADRIAERTMVYEEMRRRLVPVVPSGVIGHILGKATTKL